MDMDMPGMSHHSHGGGSSSSAPTKMNAADMNMVFFSATDTPLLFGPWVPKSAGAYAGTCIFLIVLAILWRGSFSLKSSLERRWYQSAVKRRYIVVADQTPTSERLSRDPDSKEGVLTTNGIDESVKVVDRRIQNTQAFRLSVDVPRALLVTVTSAIGYFLMISVMTMNIGYFCSVLAGIFIGEIVCGRFNHHE